MSNFTNDPDIMSIDKVQCECGSQILLKNMPAHSKTKKHLTGLEKKLNPKVKVAKEPKDKTKEPKDKTKEQLPKELTVDVTSSKDTEEEEEEDVDDIDIILDSIQSLHDRLDEIQQLMTVGFTHLLEEEHEEVTDSEKVVEPKKQVKSVTISEKKE